MTDSGPVYSVNPKQDLELTLHFLVTTINKYYNGGHNLLSKAMK